MTAIPKKRGRPAKAQYAISLTLGDSVFAAKGKTMYEALSSLEKPVKIFTKGVLEVSKGNNKRVQPMTIPQSRRLFQPLAQVVLAKQLSYGL